jgi:hypothetical protein
MILQPLIWSLKALKTVVPFGNRITGGVGFSAGLADIEASISGSSSSFNKRCGVSKSTDYYKSITVFLG